MIFEVDNTTEQLIKELQNSIIDTISYLNEGQSEIKKIVSDIELEFALASKEEQVQSLNIELNKVGKNVKQQGIEITEEIANIGEKIDAFYLINNEKDLKVSDKIDSKAEEVRKQLETMKDELCERVSDNKEAGITANKESERLLDERMNQLHSEITEILTKLMCTVLEHNKKTQDDIKHSFESMESIEAESVKLRNFIEKSEKIESLSEQISQFEDQIKAIQNDIQSKLGFISEQAKDVSFIEHENEKMLLSISDYLKLPGYKRFFKGMEVNNFEN